MRNEDWTSIAQLHIKSKQKLAFSLFNNENSEIWINPNYNKNQHLWRDAIVNITRIFEIEHAFKRYEQRTNTILKSFEMVTAAGKI